MNDSFTCDKSNSDKRAIFVANKYLTGTVGNCDKTNVQGRKSQDRAKQVHLKAHFIQLKVLYIKIYKK